MNPTAPAISGYVLLLAVQILFLILYAVFVRYDNNLLPKYSNESLPGGEEVIGDSETKHVPSYPRECYHLPFD